MPYTEGDRISLTCSSSGGNPAPTFVWRKQRKNGTEVDLTPGYILMNKETPVPMGVSSSLIVVAMDYTDNGAVYYCFVHNVLNVGSPLSGSVPLTVLCMFIIFTFMCLSIQLYPKTSVMKYACYFILVTLLRKIDYHFPAYQDFKCLLSYDV